MATANELLLDAMLAHQIGLLRLSGGIRNRVFKLLDATEKDIALQIRGRLASHNGLDTPASVRRLNFLLRRITAIRARAWGEVTKAWFTELKALVREEVTLTASIVERVSPVSLVFELPTAATLGTIVSTRPFEGRTLSRWAQNVRRADISRIQAQIRIGMVQGEGSATIARRVVGTVRAKGRNGVTQITRRNAEAITRTAVNHVSNQARREFFQANKHVFAEEQYVATLDSRTTPICRALDGQRFPVGEGRFPPQHFGCRSIRVAVLGDELIGTRPANPTTERQLLREYTGQRKIPTPTRRADLPRGHKKAFDAFSRKRKRELIGTVPAKTTYQEWLKRQSAEMQDDVLGVTRGKLFRKGNLTVQDFVDQKGKTLTLRQLREREAGAFRRADIGE